MAEQDYQKEFRQVVTLTAGLNLISTILTTFAPNMIHALSEYQVRVTSGGPVAYGSSTMAAITDGPQLALDESHRKSGGPGDPIQAQFEGLWATATGDKVFLYCRALSGG